jgi:fumarate hydratase subunit alpha
LDAVVAAGPNPCPPLVVGIGIGGCLDSAAESAKKAFLRPIQEANADPVLDGLERELKVEINRLGYGPAGTGGRITCLAVRALAKPSHIATLPVAVDISCYALRRKSETI